MQVRTTARAREDGSQGDLITVESLTERKPFFARVCGPQEVEVLPDSVRVAAVESSAAAASAQPAVVRETSRPANPRR